MYISDKMSMSNWLATHPLLNKSVVVVIIIGSYYLCRQTAIHISKQTDVVRKKPSEHYEDLIVSICIVLILMAHHQKLQSWPAWITLPVAGIIFAWISDLKGLQSSLNAASVTLMIVLAVVVTLFLGSIGYLGYRQPGALLPIAKITGISLLYVVSLYIAARADALEGTKSVVHIHHWQIGLFIAMTLGYFDSRIAVVLASIGLAVFVQGTSVYRLTSPFCGWRVPCSITRYRDVPSVKIN